MDQQSEIRDFLTSRRARVTPEQVGLGRFAGPRRVPGLRREEVAQLAGVSVDYYTRLERGKTKGASVDVLDSIARALRLDDVERDHLVNLFATGAPARARSRRPAQRRTVRPALQKVLDSMSVPAVINNDHQDMVASNHLARAIYPHATEPSGEPFNHARFLFLDPRAPEFFQDWELATHNTVALLRAAAGRNPHDDGLIRLVGQLSTQSDAFRTLWAAHDVLRYKHGAKRYHHPLVGDLDFGYESFELPTDPGLTMLVYTVEGGTPTEDALRILASWTSSERGRAQDAAAVDVEHDRKP